MTAPAQDPGYATLGELTAYWRTPSVRATRELARTVGLRQVRGNTLGSRYGKSKGLRLQFAASGTSSSSPT